MSALANGERNTSPVVGASADLSSRLTGDQQHEPDDEEDYAESPQERDAEHETEEEKNKSNCDHDLAYPAKGYLKHARLPSPDPVML